MEVAHDMRVTIILHKAPRGFTGALPYPDPEMTTAELEAKRDHLTAMRDRHIAAIAHLDTDLLALQTALEARAARQRAAYAPGDRPQG